MDFLASVRQMLAHVGDMELHELTGLHDDAASRYFLVGSVELPVRVDGQTVELDWYVGGSVPDLGKVGATAGGSGYEDLLLLSESLTMSSVVRCSRAPDAVPVVRVHSCCFTGDVVGSQRCDCGDQLRNALQAIVARGNGCLVYEASHEGRGIGLLGKLLAYRAQSQGLDTYTANVKLGFPADRRRFGFARAVLHHLYLGTPVDLLTNNPDKVHQLASALPVTRRVAPGRVGRNNIGYLRAKKDYGHMIDLDDADDLADHLAADA